MSDAAKTVLVVDDVELFLRAVTDGFRPYAEKVRLLTAANGRLALEVLRRERVDLLVTDLAMPEMDGFALLSQLTRELPDLPVIVLTAYGTQEIESRLSALGIGNYIDKPVDIPQLAGKVLETLAATASGTVTGITVPSFVQLIRLEQKTCVLRVRSQGRTARLDFTQGELTHAEAGGLRGEPAALEAIGWEEVEIEIVAARPSTQRTVRASLTQLLLDGLRLKDERARDRGEGGAEPESADEISRVVLPESVLADLPGVEVLTLELDGDDDEPRDSSATDVSGSWTPQVQDPMAATGPAQAPAKEEAMTAKEKLHDLASVEGVAGVAVFTPMGEELVMIPGTVTNLKDVGILANNVLLNAQKASLEMGSGRGQMVHVEGERAHILVRCLNEGTDPLKSQPGRAHIHTVVVMKPDASIGMVKMRLNAAVERIAEDFR